MPVSPMPELPTTVDECHKVILKQWSRNTELEVRAEQTVGGFLERNGKSIIAIMLGVLGLLGGGNLIFNGVNHSETEKTQQEVRQVQQKLDPEQPDSIAKRVEEVGSGVDDIKREVKKKKGPFGE